MSRLALTTLLLVLAAEGALLLAIAQPGCVRPPKDTLFVDLNNDGKVDALAWDRSPADGVADTNAEGQPDLVPGSGMYKTTETIDAFVPDLLMTIGGALAVPILVGVGAVWKSTKWGRIFTNTVMSVQIARQRLQDKGLAESLVIVDEALSGQTVKTSAAVDAAKEKLGMASVTDQTAPDST